MPVTLRPPPGYRYPSHQAALEAWREGAPFVVVDRSHPRDGETVRQGDLFEPVRVLKA